MSVCAITFDFWCTLFRDENGAARHQLRIEALSRAAGVPEEAADQALAIAWAEFTRSHRDLQRTLVPEDAVRIAAKSLGVNLDREAVRDVATVFGTAILEHPPEPVQGALDAVRAAADAYPVGLISDTGVSPGSSLRRLLERNGFFSLFGAVTFSDEVGVSKPQAPMFETAAQDLGVGPAELFHIGDLEDTDVAGARNVGAKAALFTAVNAGDLERTQADYTFSSWQEFLEILPQLS